MTVPNDSDSGAQYRRKPFGKLIMLKCCRSQKTTTPSGPKQTCFLSLQTISRSDGLRLGYYVYADSQQILQPKLSRLSRSSWKTSKRSGKPAKATLTRARDSFDLRCSVVTRQANIYPRRTGPAGRILMIGDSHSR